MQGHSGFVSIQLKEYIDMKMSITIRQHRLKKMNQIIAGNSGICVCVWGGLVGWLVCGWRFFCFLFGLEVLGLVAFYLFVLEGHGLGDVNISCFLLISANQTKNSLSAYLYFSSSQY